MTRAAEQTLQDHAFVHGLTVQQIATIASIAREQTFEEDEIILVEGQSSSTFYLMVSGSVSIELRTPRYGVCVQALGPGAAFGWSSLLDHQDTLFQARARERVTAYGLSGAALKRLCREDPAMGVELLQRILALVAGRVKATELRFAEMCGVRV